LKNHLLKCGAEPFKNRHAVGDQVEWLVRRTC